ncbi:MAG: ribonuclease R [Hyphomicrobiales bacterium]
MVKKRSKDFDRLPSKDDVLRFIADNPGNAGKREIAKAFGVKGADRIGLKRLLREMADEGTVQRRRKKLSRPGEVPSVTVLHVFARDDDGELLAKPDKWDENQDGNPPLILLLRSPRDRGPAPGIGDRVLAKLTREGETQPKKPTHTGKLIRVLEKERGPTLGILGFDSEGKPRLIPVDKKQKELIVHASDAAKAKKGDLVSVRIDKPSKYGLPIARIIDVIGNMTNEKAVSAIALHAHNIPHVFPDKVLTEADAAGAALLKGREDWRGVQLVTIDPADAKDHDDAVYAEPDSDPLNTGGYIVSVAIADVSWYVRPGSALDTEALLRGNSVYFPDHVVPMLPERISNDLCSLREGVDRPAIAVKMIFDSAGNKVSHTFHRIMMRSAAKLSYQQAQAAIDGMPDEQTEPLLDSILKPLWAAYEVATRGRHARGPLELNLPERKILLTDEGTVDRVFVPERLDAHKLIEEFMIQANVAAAESLEAKKSALVYRVHETPSLDKLESLREFLRSLDINLSTSGSLRPHHFNDILARVENTEHEIVVNQVVLRSQSQAAYSPANLGHFGLNLRRYAHFTSPIRRYADLIVHRALVSALELGEGGLPAGFETQLEQIAADISSAERRAMLAERDTIDRLISAHLADHIGAKFYGQISGVTKVGLFVKLNDTGADGFIPISKLGWDYFFFDEAQHSLVGEKSRERYRIGDQVEVKLVEAAPVAGALRFEMLSEGTKVSGKGNARPKRTNRSRRKKPGTSRRRGRR